MRRALAAAALIACCALAACDDSPPPPKPYVIHPTRKDTTWRMNRDGSVQRARSIGDGAWSPGGGRLARTEGVDSLGIHRRVVVTARGGRVLHRLGPRSHGIESIGDLEWSPDGSRVSWVLSRGDSEIVNRRTLVTASARGDDYRVITAFAFGYAWSPRSDRIAYVDIRGGDARLVTSTPTGHERRTLAHQALEALDWSHDGRTIVYRHGDPPPRQGIDDHPDIWAVDVDGGPPRMLDRGVFLYLGLSPDGHWALVTRRYRDHSEALWAIRVDGTGRRRVADRVHPVQSIYGWTPDGRVYVLSGRDGHLLTYDLAGDRRDLGYVGTGLGATQFPPVAWSKDGKLVAWGNGLRAGFMHADGSHRRTLVRFSPEADIGCCMRWLPDGSGVLMFVLVGGLD